MIFILHPGSKISHQFFLLWSTVFEVKLIWFGSSRCLFKKRNWAPKMRGTVTVAKSWSPKFGSMVMSYEYLIYSTKLQVRFLWSLNWIAIFRHKEAFKKLEQLGMHVRVLPNNFVENNFFVCTFHSGFITALQFSYFSWSAFSTPDGPWLNENGISHCQLQAIWGRSRERLNNPVSFPLENLDLSPYLTVQSWVAETFFSIFSPFFFSNQRLPENWEASARETSTVTPVPSQDGLPKTPCGFS